MILKKTSPKIYFGIPTMIPPGAFPGGFIRISSKNSFNFSSKDCFINSFKYSYRTFSQIQPEDSFRLFSKGSIRNSSKTFQNILLVFLQNFLHLLRDLLRNHLQGLFRKFLKGFHHKFY